MRRYNDLTATTNISKRLKCTVKDASMMNSQTHGLPKIITSWNFLEMLRTVFKV